MLRGHILSLVKSHLLKVFSFGEIMSDVADQCFRCVSLGVGEGEFRGKRVEAEVPVMLLEQFRWETTWAKFHRLPSSTRYLM